MKVQQRAALQNKVSDAGSSRQAAWLLVAWLVQTQEGDVG